VEKIRRRIGKGGQLGAKRHLTTKWPTGKTWRRERNFLDPDTMTIVGATLGFRLRGTTRVLIKRKSALLGEKSWGYQQGRVQ